MWVARVWAGWRQSLVIVTPGTVLRWQRRRFREHWTTLSGRPTGGRPPVWRVFLKREGSTYPVIIREVRGQDAMQV